MNAKNRLIPLVLSLLIAAPLLVAQEIPRLTLDQPWGEHMVIQANRQSQPSGTAKPDAIVKITLKDKTSIVKADKHGRWKAFLPAMHPGGPWQFLVSSKDEHVEYKDVLIGEVWLASGQSNMEWQMSATSDAAKEIPLATQDQIRLFSVERKLDAVQGGKLQGQWKVCTPKNVKDFSAVAYHFGLELSKNGNLPLGLVSAPWSGTPGEAWVDNAATQKEKSLNKIYSRWQARSEAEKEMWLKGWRVNFNYKDIAWIKKDGSLEPIHFYDLNAAAKPGSTASHQSGRYRAVLKPGAWSAAQSKLKKDGSGSSLKDYKGIRFKAKGNTKMDIALTQPNIQDGSHYAMPAFEPTAQWEDYEFYFKDLKQGGWGSPRDLTLNKITAVSMRAHGPNQFPDQPGILFDAMIRPLAAFEFQGAIWYQGESNLGRTDEYAALLKSIALGWRSVFNNSKLIFIVAQLPDFGSPGSNDGYGSWAPFRSAQAEILDMPFTGLAVTLGLGDGMNWHPRNKKPVGQRLAHEALRLAYGHKTARGYGPRFKAHQKQGKQWFLSFDTGEQALSVSTKRLLGFEVKKQGHWEPVAAQLQNGKVVILAENISGIRYAWQDNPVASLRNELGLPALGFSILF